MNQNWTRDISLLAEDRNNSAMDAIRLLILPKWIMGLSYSLLANLVCSIMCLIYLLSILVTPSTPDGSNSGVEVGVISAPRGGGGAGRGMQLASVALVKGERGLGFTITTRDNPTGGVCPIYIKNILPKVRDHIFIFEWYCWMCAI